MKKIIPDGATYAITYIKTSVFVGDAPGYILVSFSNGVNVRFNISAKDGLIVRNRNVAMTDAFWETLEADLNDKYEQASSGSWKRGLVEMGWISPGYASDWSDDLND